MARMEKLFVMADVPADKIPNGLETMGPSRTRKGYTRVSLQLDVLVRDNQDQLLDFLHLHNPSITTNWQPFQRINILISKINQSAGENFVANVYNDMLQSRSYARRLWDAILGRIETVRSIS